ncbi:hypothetical protein [Paraburkholderia aromaticivorans]|uniref:hypothetical protein n=1 Tax=Paraburkholderia aromaticivorans TaxID=2026199 RepID=UPI0038B738CD
MLSDADAAPRAFLVEARELETQIAAEKKRFETLEHELAASANNATPAAAEAWAAPVHGVEQLDYDAARKQVRQPVAATFSKSAFSERVSTWQKPLTTRSTCS